jgi:hypothetical protein
MVMSIATPENYDVIITPSPDETAQTQVYTGSNFVTFHPLHQTPPLTYLYSSSYLWL